MKIVQSLFNCDESPLSDLQLGDLLLQMNKISQHLFVHLLMLLVRLFLDSLHGFKLCFILFRSFR